MNLKYFISNIREDDFNITVLNYLLLFYTFFLLVSRSTSWLVVVIFIVFFINKEWKSRIKISLKNRVVQAFIVYFLTYLIWMIGSENIDIALYEIKNNLLLLYPILFVAMMRAEFVKRFFDVILVGLFFSAILWINIYFSLIQLPFIFPEFGMPFLYKSDYGFFLLVGVGYALFKLLIEKDLHNGYKIFLVLFLILATVNIFISGARTFMFLYVIGIAFIGFVVYKEELKKIILFLIAGGIIFFIAIGTSEVIKHQVYDIIDGIEKSFTSKDYDSSSGARVGMIVHSLPVIKENWIFGVGTGDHVVSVVEEILKDPFFDGSVRYAELFRALHIGKSSHLHNTYIQSMVQFGIVGTLLMLNVFFQILKYKQDDLILNSMLKYMVILFLVSGFSGVEFMFNNLGKFYVLVISILLVHIENQSISQFTNKEKY